MAYQFSPRDRATQVLKGYRGQSGPMQPEHWNALALDIEAEIADAIRVERENSRKNSPDSAGIARDNRTSA